MPSPSPTSRKSASSAANRNLSGLTRPDLLAPRGLHQGIRTSSTISAAQALHEKIDDHKENSTENGNSKEAHGRSNQNLRGTSSKKPWVTHFAKPASTLSPSKRVLVDRNSSCSPVRSGSITPRNGETFSDKKVPRATPPRDQREEAPATPGPVKGVAELSKRIQQFLEDQDILLGVKTGSGHEVTSTSSSVTPVDPGQRTLSSSPYNPYKSPFFERPKFLRLNGNAPSMEEADTVATPLGGADNVPNSMDGAGMPMEQTTEDLSLLEGDQVLVTPLQQIQFCTGFPTENEEMGHVENSEEQISGAAGLEEASVDALEAKVMPIPEEKTKCLHESNIEVHKQIEDASPALLTNTSGEDENETGDVTIQAENQKDAGNMQHVKVKDDKALPVGAIPLEGFQISQDEDHEEVANSDELDLMDGDVCWGKKAARVLFCGTLLAAFIALTLLSSASPGLLPASLVNNPVQSFWHASKYHEHSMMLVRGMDGLWSTEMIYLPADVRVAVLKGAELLQSIGRLSDQANQEVQLYVQVMSSIVDDWKKVLVQHLSLTKTPDMEGEHEDRGRQFEWIQDYEFEEEWLDEIPKLAYTDWELLHEYDLGAANEFVLGSIPEILKNDLRRNFSRLSDSPEVKGLLEDLLKLKGGSTEEDRLEVLQYFWEYTRYSASAHESLMKFEVVPTEVENGSTDQGFPSSSEVQDMLYASNTVEVGLNQDSETMQSTDNDPLQIDEKHDLRPREEQSDLTEDPCLDLTGTASEKVEIKNKLSEMATELIQTTSEKLQESTGNEEPQALVSTVYENGGAWMDAINEPQSEDWDGDMLTAQVESTGYEEPQALVSTVYENGGAWIDAINEPQSEDWDGDMLTAQVQPIQPTSDAKLDLALLAILATFIVVSLSILGYYHKQSKNATKLIPPASSVQFLKKTDQPPKSLDDEIQQDRQQVTVIEELNHKFALDNEIQQDREQVTMIEELNDKFASVLQSPEPNLLHQRSLHARKDEDLMRSPIPASANSPYGSFTTFKLMAKKEGQAVETKLTPVRRSSRIRNNVSMSPNAKRIAISPP